MALNVNRVREQVQKWRDDLVNLNRRNKLLYFKHTKTSTLQIGSPTCADILELLETRPGRLEFYHGVIEPDALPGMGRTVRPPKPSEAVCQVWKGTVADGGLRDATNADLTKTLRSLDRQARAEFMDRGLQSLYLGMGLLEWIDSKVPDEVNSGPLFLVPVELERTGPGDPYRLVRALDDVVVNPALQLKLENDFGVTLPAVDDDDCGCDAYFDRVRAAVRNQPGWAVKEVAVLSRFSFLKEVMYRDLLEHEDEICEHPLVRALASPAGSRSDFDFDPVGDEDLDRVAVDTTLLSIRDADATQRACIWAAREGRTFVMDGPPGTGKSQTIANMIAELIGNGRSVLFVSEKAAALEVVHSRLEECGLDEYVLQLHSHKATRREVATQLSKSVTKRPSMDGQLSDAEVSALHKRRKQLSEYAAAMNEVRDPLGMSLFDAIGRAARLNDVTRPAVRADIDINIGAGRFASILSAAAELQRAWGPVERGDEFVWRDLSIGRLDAARRAEIGELLDSAVAANAAVEGHLDEAKVALQGWMPGDGVVGLQRVVRLVEAVSAAHQTRSLWLSHETYSELESAVDELGHLRTQHDVSLQAVRSIAASTASRADALEISESYRDALALGEAAQGWAPDPSWTKPDLATATEECEKITAILERDVPDLLSQIATATGVNMFDKPSLADARDLAGLLGMAESAERPEAEWLNLTKLSELRNAKPVLTALITGMREKRHAIESTFVATVMDVDAEALYQRFTQVHVGMGRVSIGYFKDRKALASVSRTGKFSQAAVALLPVVVELQKLSADLKAFERDQAGLIGSYYRGEETDLERLDRAVKVAESALDLVERRIGLSRALGTVALQSDIDPGVLLAARRLRTTSEESSSQLARLGVDVDAVFALPMSEAVARLTATQEAMEGWGRLAGSLSPEVLLGDVGACGQSATEVLAAVTEEETVRPRLRALIGDDYAGLDTDVEALCARVQGALAIREVLGGAVPTAVGDRVLAPRLDARDMSTAVDNWMDVEKNLLSLFSDERAKALEAELNASCPNAERILKRMAASLDDIDEWIAFTDSSDRLAGLGLEDAVRACVTQQLSQGEIAKIIERIVLETWIDAVVDSDSERLSPLRARDRQALRREFVQLDKRLVRAAAGRVMRSCNERRPSKNVGAVGIILREGEKKTRHMPIRTLLEKTKSEAQAIKPCFMMSPLSVSQFLPADLRFDVVLFDEASQIRPHDAINCIYRGTQHIVAGDQQQLPPTSFFDGVRDDGDDVWNEEDLESFESVLDVAKSCASIPSLPLRWHYRSRHEDLITYSNVSFYDSSLISFPAPHVTAPTLGVGFNKVDGVYRRGRGTPNDNPIEAHEVAKLVAHYAKHYPKLSLGVVAFSSAQEEAIENAIDQLRIDDPTLPNSYFDTQRLNGFFVKNLETVQGDERDVIILSVGYGRDETGKILMNFGPINQAGGYRRLNVAVTRARMRLELVASITGADISSASENDGVRHMKRYLEYAERGPSVLTVGDGRSLGEEESPFELEVARLIRSWGYDVATQVGTAGYRIDLALVHPDQPGRLCLAIECDGAAYHSSKVARDRDRLRDEVLQGLGWRIHRIWGTAWYRQRDLAETELRQAIENAVRACDGPDASEGTRGLENAVPSIHVEEVEVDDDFEDEDWVVDYHVHVPSLSALDKRIPMGDRSASPIMQRELPGIVRAEGPVHRDAAVDRLKEAWSTKRAGHNIMSEFDAALRYCERAGYVECDDQGFLWAGADRLISKARRPVQGDSRTQRGCGQVSREEYDFAVARILSSVNSIGEAQLARNVAAVFGWERLGADIRDRIEDSVLRVVDAEPGFADRIVSDDDLPRLQSAGRAATRLANQTITPKPAATKKSEETCPVCRFGFGKHSKPIELAFFEDDGTTKKLAHQSCVDGLRTKRKSMARYEWDGIRGGVVPMGSRMAAPKPTNVQPNTLPGPHAVGWDPDTNTPIIG